MVTSGHFVGVGVIENMVLSSTVNYYYYYYYFSVHHFCR